ncbi:MAG TPA: D-serine ammonia-lyase, partial [Motiliproteus sp.]
MSNTPITPATLHQWQHSHPLLQPLMATEELCWINPSLQPFFLAQRQLPLGMIDMQDASDRLQRFASYIAHTFPSTAAAAGVIESPLRPIPA